MKSALRRLLQTTGLDLRRTTSVNHDHGQALRILSHHGVRTVLDVGANIGQFASAIFRGGFAGSIVSFEPLLTAHRVLGEKASRHPRWYVERRCAIGDTNTNGIINVSANSVSSSLRKINLTAPELLDVTACAGQDPTPIRRLDSLWTRLRQHHEPPFYLKIDTQGYEKEVIIGAGTVLNHIALVQCELSLVEIYEGEMLWLDFMELMRSKGFSPVALQKGFVDPGSGHGLQVDVIFKNDKVL